MSRQQVSIGETAVGGLQALCRQCGWLADHPLSSDIFGLWSAIPPVDGWVTRCGVRWLDGSPSPRTVSPMAPAVPGDGVRRTSSNHGKGRCSRSSRTRACVDAKTQNDDDVCPLPRPLTLTAILPEFNMRAASILIHENRYKIKRIFLCGFELRIFYSCMRLSPYNLPAIFHLWQVNWHK